MNDTRRQEFVRRVCRIMEELEDVLQRLKRSTLQEDGPLTPKQLQARAKRDQARRDRQREIQATTAIKVGAIQKKMGQ